MTRYTLLLTIHIISVSAWVGADLLQYVVTPKLDREPSDALLAWARVQHFLHDRYYAAFAVVLLASGIGMVLDGPYTRSSGFVWVGVGAIAVGVVVGGGILGTLTKRRVAALESGDADGAASIRKRMLAPELVVTAAAIVAMMTMVGKWRA